MLARSIRRTHILLSMARNTSTPQQLLPPGVYLQISAASTQPSQEPFDITNNPWYKKYAGKLEQLKQTNLSLYEEKLELLKARYAPVNPTPEQDEGSPVDVPPTDDQMERTIIDSVTPKQTKPKTLESIMKVELLKDKTVEEITQIWSKYHSQKPYVYSIIPGDEYDEMQRRLKDYPLFMYPMPRGEGYEFFIQQTSHNTCYFSPLLAYQTHKENAPSCLTLDHYTELKNDKGIVLLRGEVDKNIMGLHEAQLLALQVKMYYGLQSGLKFNLVRQFNNDSANFKYMDLIKQFENFKKDSKQYSSDRDSKEYATQFK